jgi:hypothetical protein
MNGDICAARKLLAELREAYRGLPTSVQTHLTSILREATLQPKLGECRLCRGALSQS